MGKRSLHRLIADNQTDDIGMLSSEAAVLAELLQLIVDIKYRHRYSSDTPLNIVLADQVPPVDDGLLGHTRREVSGL